MKNHPGKEPPPSARDKAALAAAASQQQPSQRAEQQQNFNPTYSATVGSVTSQPHNCPFCHKQYATNAKLLQHQRKDHPGQQEPIVPNSVPKNSQALKSEANLASASDSGLRVVTVMADGSHGAELQMVQNSNENASWIESANAANLHHAPAQGLLEPQQPPSQQAMANPPSNLEYRLDGEVLQLTRVAQDEALRLVNSGATVIHVATDDPEPLPGPSRGQ